MDSSIIFDNDNIYLAVAEKELDTIFNKKGLHLYLINSKNGTLELQTMDGSIYLTHQAKDIFGNWKNIETYPRSWCGNSYSTIYLKANSYLRFTVPQYNGIFNTELRFCLVLSPYKILYSNAYQGSINLGQLFIKGKYMANGIMDPYY